MLTHKKSRFAALCAASAAVLATACGPNHPSRAQEGETCFDAWVSCGGRTVESCCSGNSQCAYRISDGKDFPCDGTDCSKAAHDAAAYCQSSN